MVTLTPSLHGSPAQRCRRHWVTDAPHHQTRMAGEVESLVGADGGADRGGGAGVAELTPGVQVPSVLRRRWNS